MSLLFAGRPKAAYENPCSLGVPVSDANGAPEVCQVDTDCPTSHVCTKSKSSAVCCLDPLSFSNATEADIVEVSILWICVVFPCE